MLKLEPKLQEKQIRAGPGRDGGTASDRAHHKQEAKNRKPYNSSRPSSGHADGLLEDEDASLEYSSGPPEDSALTLPREPG